MNDPYLGLIAMLFVAGVATFSLSLVVRMRRRVPRMAACAKALGFSFDPAGTSVDLTRLEDFARFAPKLRKLTSRSLTRNAMRGRDSEFEITVFDYLIPPQRDWQRSRPEYLWRRCTAVCVGADSLSLPRFDLTPAVRTFERVMEAIGWGDINFESHAEFSRMHSLRGPDAAAIRSRFTVDVLHFLASRPLLSVDAVGRHLLVEREGRSTSLPRFMNLTKPEAIPELVADAVRLARLLSTRA